MSKKKKWLIVSLSIVVVCILVLLLFPVKGIFRVTVETAPSQRPNLETFLKSLFISIKDLKGQAIHREVLGVERYDSIPLSKGTYRIEIETLDGVNLLSEELTIPWGNLCFKPRTQEVRFTVPPAVEIRPENVSFALKEEKLWIRWKNSGWSKKATFQVSVTDFGTLTTENNELYFPIESNALTQLDALNVRIRVLSGNQYQTLYSGDLPVKHFKKTETKALSAEQLEVSWEHEKGTFTPTGYRILVDGREYASVGPSATSETLDLETLNPQPNEGKRREINLTLEAISDGIVLSRSDSVFYMYETVFSSTLNDEWRTVNETAPLKVFINERPVALRLEGETIKAFYLSFLPEETLTVEYTVNDYSILRRTMPLREERETEAITLPSFSRVFSAQAEVTEDERLYLQWSTDRSEGKINPTRYYVETPQGTQTTTENAIHIPYESKEQEIKLFSVFFGTVSFLEKAIIKPGKPGLTLIRIDYDHKEDAIVVEGRASIKTPFTVLYRIDRYAPEGGWPEERAGLIYEVSQKEWIVAEDVITSEAGEFSFWIPVKDLQALPPLEQPLKINGSIKVLDTFNQSAVKDFEVVRFLPPKVEFVRFLINDEKLLLEWKAEDPVLSQRYRDFAVNVTTSSGESYRYEATQTSLEIDLSALKDYRLTLTLEALWENEIVRLDDRSFEFLPLDFNRLVDWNLGKSGKETWKIVYYVKYQKGFESISFEAFDQQQQESLKKTFDTITGSFEWPIKSGKTYLIRAGIKYDIETNKDLIPQTVTTEVYETIPPSTGGIKEAYQIAKDKIRLEAIDSAPGMEYYWTISNKNNERYTFTAFSPVYDAVISRKDGLTGVWSVHLRAVHSKTNTVFSETQDIYTMKADDYLYEDVPAKQEKTIKTNNGFVSRSIKVNQDAVLRITQSRLKLPPKTSLRIEMGTLYLEEDVRLNVMENENNELWEGVYIFGGRVYVKRAIEVSNAAIAFQLYSSEGSIEDTSFLNSQKGILAQGSKLKVSGNSRFATIGLAISARNSEVTVENTFFRNVQEGFLFLNNKLIRMYQVNITGVEKRGAYIATSKDVELSNVTIDGIARDQQEGFFIEDSVVRMRNITLKNLKTGLIFVNTDASLDSIIVYQVTDGIHLEYAYFELNNSTMEADNLGVFAITSPILRTREFSGFLPTTGKVGSFAGLIRQTTVKAPVAVKIERGENHIAVENSQLIGEIIHGGIQVNPNGLPYYRGEIIQK